MKVYYCKILILYVKWNNITYHKIKMDAIDRKATTKMEL